MGQGQGIGGGGVARAGAGFDAKAVGRPAGGDHVVRNVGAGGAFQAHEAVALPMLDTVLGMVVDRHRADMDGDIDLGLHSERIAVLAERQGVFADVGAPAHHLERHLAVRRNTRQRRPSLRRPEPGQSQTRRPADQEGAPSHLTARPARGFRGVPTHAFVLLRSSERAT